MCIPLLSFSYSRAAHPAGSVYLWVCKHLWDDPGLWWFQRELNIIIDCLIFICFFRCWILHALQHYDWGASGVCYAGTSNPLPQEEASVSAVLLQDDRGPRGQAGCMGQDRWWHRHCLQDEENTHVLWYLLNKQISKDEHFIENALSFLMKLKQMSEQTALHRGKCSLEHLLNFSAE